VQNPVSGAGVQGLLRGTFCSVLTRFAYNTTEQIADLKSSRQRLPRRCATAIAHRPQTPRPLLAQAARRSRMIGKWPWPPWNSTSRANRPPGCPATSTCGLAQGEPRDQRGRGSRRGRRCAGKRLKYTSLGVRPRSERRGRYSLYQPIRKDSSRRSVAARRGIGRSSNSSYFNVLTNRSITAMLPRWPTAPKRGRIPRRRHQRRYPAVGQNTLPLSLMRYFGAVPARRIARPRKERTATARGACLKTA
jgi:hypothetical protein